MRNTSINKPSEEKHDVVSNLKNVENFLRDSTTHSVSTNLFLKKTHFKPPLSLSVTREATLLQHSLLPLRDW